MTGISCGGSRPSTPRRKKRGLMSSLYAAFFGAAVTADSKKPKSPESPTGASASGTISMLVSSIRPLHIVDGSQSPPSPTTNSSTPKTSYASADFGDKVFEVDEDLKIEENNKAESDDVQQEEEMMSVKAEKMIGKFYQQIRLQALNSIGSVRA